MRDPSLTLRALTDDSWFSLSFAPRAAKMLAASMRHPQGDGASMAGMTIGKFAVVSTLGTGAHSTILQVRRNADFKNYALKVVQIDGEEEMKFLDQARHEFRVAQLLDHPSLIKIYALES